MECLLPPLGATVEFMAPDCSHVVGHTVGHTVGHVVGHVVGHMMVTCHKHQGREGAGR